jgi:glyoxylase I family protein
LGAEDTGQMLKNFEHVGMTVSDLDRTLRFYCDLIGFRLLVRRTAPGGTEVAFIEAPGGAQLELVRPPGDIARPARPVANTEAGIRHVTFAFDDLDRTFAGLVAAGVTVIEKPRDAVNRDMLARVAFVLDPDGIVVELVQRSPERGG